MSNVQDLINQGVNPELAYEVANWHAMGIEVDMDAVSAQSRNTTETMTVDSLLLPNDQELRYYQGISNTARSEAKIGLIMLILDRTVKLRAGEIESRMRQAKLDGWTVGDITGEVADDLIDSLLDGKAPSEWTPEINDDYGGSPIQDRYLAYFLGVRSVFLSNVTSKIREISE